MKRILFIAFATVLLAACGKDSYKIKGEIAGVEDGTVVTLSIFEYDGLTDLDSAVVKGGKFTFTGKTDTADVAAVTYMLDDMLRGCQFFLEPGNIEVLIDAESGNQHVSGTPNNDALQALYDEAEILEEEAEEIEDKIRVTLAAQGDASEFYAQMGELQDRYTTILIKSIEDNADKIFGYQQLLDNYSMLEPEDVMRLLEKLAPTFGSDPLLQQMAVVTSSQMATSLGQPYIDFEGALLDKKYGFDKTAKLSDYIGKNKVVLLDFWASWCTPCLNEVPNLKAAYNRFKSMGFEIVSVSVDDGTDEWIKAVKDNGMNWVQLWNGEDMENSAAAKYLISAIPTTFLIDSEGTIIGRNLRDKELEEALADFFSASK